MTCCTAVGIDARSGKIYATQSGLPAMNVEGSTVGTKPVAFGSGCPMRSATPCDLPAINSKTILVSAFLSARIIPAGDSDALLHEISGLPLVP